MVFGAICFTVGSFLLAIGALWCVYATVYMVPVIVKYCSSNKELFDRVYRKPTIATSLGIAIIVLGFYVYR